MYNTEKNNHENPEKEEITIHLNHEQNKRKRPMLQTWGNFYQKDS